MQMHSENTVFFTYVKSLELGSYVLISSITIVLCTINSTGFKYQVLQQQDKHYREKALSRVCNGH